MTFKNSASGVKEHFLRKNSSERWLEDFVSKIREGEYESARTLLYRHKKEWSDDLRETAKICSRLYPIMQSFLYQSNLREAKRLASYFSELEIEYWIPTNKAQKKIDKPYKCRSRS